MALFQAWAKGKRQGICPNGRQTCKQVCNTPRQNLCLPGSARR